GLPQTRVDAEWRLARLSFAQSAVSGGPACIHPPRLRRAQLPSHRRPRQHAAARVAALDRRSRLERAGGRLRLRALQLAARDGVTTARAGHTSVISCSVSEHSAFAAGIPEPRADATG